MDEIVARLEAYRPLVPLAPNAASETARRFTFNDGLGEIGIIAPVSRPFCGHCSRIRLTSDGKIRTCLFSQTDHDLERRMMRGASDADMERYIRSVVTRKEARHHIGEAGFSKAVAKHGSHWRLISGCVNLLQVGWCSPRNNGTARCRP